MRGVICASLRWDGKTPWLNERFARWAMRDENVEEHALMSDVGMKSRLDDLGCKEWRCFETSFWTFETMIHWPVVSRVRIIIFTILCIIRFGSNQVLTTSVLWFMSIYCVTQNIYRYYHAQSFCSVSGFLHVRTFDGAQYSTYSCGQFVYVQTKACQPFEVNKLKTFYTISLQTNYYCL